MIIATLIVCFLLAFLPLVISTFSFRYAVNVFSTGIVTLSSVSALLGLAQFGLLLGLSYQLFSPTQMTQAPLVLQCVSIAGGAIMIVAGVLWVGYFRVLMKSKAPATQIVRTSENQPVIEAKTEHFEECEPAAEISPPPPRRRRREKPEPERDWFSDEVPNAHALHPTAHALHPNAHAFQLTAAAPPKTASGRKPTARKASRNRSTSPDNFLFAGTAPKESAA